jgi:hypothetical protein
MGVADFKSESPADIKSEAVADFRRNPQRVLAQNMRQMPG